MKNTIKYKIEEREFELKDSIKDKVDKKMLCQKCQILMKHPYVVNCNHNFCKDCLKILKKCPIDDQEITSKLLRKNLKLKIQKLKIKCPMENKENKKCPWEGLLEEFEKHFRQCEYKKIICTNNCKENQIKKQSN